MTVNNKRTLYYDCYNDIIRPSELYIKNSDGERVLSCMLEIVDQSNPLSEGREVWIAGVYEYEQDDHTLPEIKEKILSMVN